MSKKKFKKKFHKYSYIEIFDNEIDELKFYLYIMNYLEGNLSKNKRKRLKYISVKRPDVLDFYHHINGKIHRANYYLIDVVYKLERYETRSKSHGVPLSTF